jgi:predicted nucleic acid-binding protein
VDIGEASTIALSIEIENGVMILDDLKARKLARKLDLNFTGTIGVLLKAREKNIISSLSEVCTKLKLYGFRISEELEKKILELDEYEV